ncbi:MAG: hypothetical protein VCA35_01470 [Roseibacillus sp.]
MHRKAVLGLLVGAANEPFPAALNAELADSVELAREITAGGKPW